MLSPFLSLSALDVPSVVGCDGCCVEGDLSSKRNCLKNSTVASTSGVATPVSGAPRCAFTWLSSLNRFQNGGRFTSSCKTALAKHIFPIFTSPRGRSRASVAPPVGREAGVEEPIERGGRWEELETEATPAS